MWQPLVSICIPCYKKPEYVVRCLQSVIRQDYKQVEVILSDDSPNEDIKAAVQPFEEALTIQYYRNDPPLKSPRNWNSALEKANGELLVLMHQDDWYHVDNALTQYVSAFDDHTDFVFCKNTAVDEKGNTYILQAIPDLPERLYKTPNHLVLAQVIGPPSNTMLRRSIPIRYDERMIWLVDVDYYVRLLKEGARYKYLPHHLVTIGLHKDQTTVFVRNNDHIILKENVLFAAKIEPKAFHDIKIYDYYWRLLRNHRVTSTTDLINAGVDSEAIPDVLKRMLIWQKTLPVTVLKKGLFSKVFMAANYFFYRIRS